MLVGPMGFANAQRSLDYIRILAEFVAQPEYRDVVAMLGVTNEPRSQIIGQENIERYYVQAYNIVRAASGAGNNPWISYHEAFAGLSNWVGFLPGADRIGLDQHPYVSHLCMRPRACADAGARSASTASLRARWSP
jgi:glucan 1,3-beta-glucosidase